MTAQTRGLARSSHPTPPKARVGGRSSDRIVYGLLGFVVVLVAWQAVVELGFVKKVLLSSPTLIFQAAVKDISSGAIWPHLQASGTEFVVGFAVALAIGVPLGLLLGSFRRLNYLLDPWLSAIYATPTVALIPLIVLIAGIGLTSKVIVVFLEAIFVITVSTMTGVRAADARHLDIARSFNASAGITFRTVTLPTSVPFILTGIRLGVGRALVGVVVSEFIASNVGIGFYISFNGSIFNSARVFFGIILLGLFGITLGELLRFVERRFDRWRPSIN